MNEQTTVQAINALRAELGPKLARIEAVIDLLLVKRLSRKEQAKKAGVSTVTLWRREQRMKLHQMANGPLGKY